MTQDNQKNYEVLSDGKTVWINGSFGCVARFSHFGYEFWYPNYSSNGVFLRDGCQRKDWVDFVKTANELFKVSIYENHVPERLRQE